MTTFDAEPAADDAAESASRAELFASLLGICGDARVAAPSGEQMYQQSSDAPRARLDVSREPLRDAAVRDLAWLLLSPDLLRPHPPLGVLAKPFETARELQATIDWLYALDATPEPLHRDLAAIRITRLGRYAERLLGWFLQHGPAGRLVASGVALRRGGVTLGECDFLVEDGQGKRLHWELAVKCYLHAGNSGTAGDSMPARLADYVGPNLKDRFDLKLSHLLNHQLPLSARDEFASTGYAGTWTPQMFVKGWLFYRHDETPADAPELDPSHGLGWWVTRSAWPAFALAHARTWRALPRLEWLAPRLTIRRKQAEAADATDAAYVDTLTLASQTSSQAGPVMVAAFVEDRAGNLIERSRGFIVADEWPEQAARYAKQ